MGQILINDGRYGGRYVATKDFDDNTVIADSKDPKEAYDLAVKKGFRDPVIFFVPIEGMVQIY